MCLVYRYLQGLDNAIKWIYLGEKKIELYVTLKSKKSIYYEWILETFQAYQVILENNQNRKWIRYRNLSRTAEKMFPFT